MSKTTVLIAEPADDEFERIRTLVTDFGLKVVRATRAAEVFALVNAGVDFFLLLHSTQSGQSHTTNLNLCVAARKGDLN